MPFFVSVQPDQRVRDEVGIESHCRTFNVEDGGADCTQLWESRGLRRETDKLSGCASGLTNDTVIIPARAGKQDSVDQEDTPDSGSQSSRRILRIMKYAVYS